MNTPLVFGATYADDKVRMVTTDLLAAPSWPIDDVFIVKLVEFDVDAVASQRPREIQYTRAMFTRIMTIADECSATNAHGFDLDMRMYVSE